MLERARGGGPCARSSSAASRARAFWWRAGWTAGRGRPSKCGGRRISSSIARAGAAHPRPAGAARPAPDEPGGLDCALLRGARAHGVGGGPSRPAAAATLRREQGAPRRARELTPAAPGAVPQRFAPAERRRAAIADRCCSIGSTPTSRSRGGTWPAGSATTIWGRSPGDCCSTSYLERQPTASRGGSVCGCWSGCTTTCACCGASFT